MIRLKNKKLLVIASVIAVLALGGGGYAYLANRANNANDVAVETPQLPGPVNEVDYGPAKESDKIAPSSKDQIIEGSTNPDGSPASASQVKVTITQATQRDTTVHIRTLLDGTTSGDCTATFSKGQASFTRTVPVGVQASSAVCQGFNVSAADFSESGEWKVKVQVSSTAGNASAESTVGVNR